MRKKKKKKRAAKCLYGCKCQIGHFESLQEGVKDLGIFIEWRQRELANASRLVRGVFLWTKKEKKKKTHKEKNMPAATRLVIIKRFGKRLNLTAENLSLKEA